MENIDFLKKILMSDSQYWIVARKVMKREYLKYVRDKDEIIFIAIPDDIKTGLKYEDIKLQDLEKLYSSYCHNIFINEYFPPFQRYISFNNIYDGYSLEDVDQQKFLIKALELKSNNLYDYKKIIKSLTNLEK